MRMVMNEKKYAEALINGDLAVRKQGTVYSIGIVAKYYKAAGYKGKMLEDIVKKFIQEKLPGTSESCSENWTKKAVKTAKNYPLYEIDEIVITKPEMETINSLHSNDIRNATLRRLAFTLLCLAKYEAMRGTKDNWINVKSKHIFLVADIKGITKQRQDIMLYTLYSLGYIAFNQKIKGESIKALGIKDGDPEITVKNINECGYIFEEKYNGKKFVRCAECGIMVRATSGRTKRCPDCAVERNRELARERMRKRRYAK